MAADYEIKRNDTGSELLATLSDAKGPIKLGTAKAIHIYLKSDSLLVKTGAVEVVDAAAGKVKYVWQAGDLKEAGIYEVEFEIIWEDDTNTTVPNNTYKSLEVFPDLAQPKDLE